MGLSINDSILGLFISFNTAELVIVPKTFQYKRDLFLFPFSKGSTVPSKSDLELPGYLKSENFYLPKLRTNSRNVRISHKYLFALFYNIHTKVSVPPPSVISTSSSR